MPHFVVRYTLTTDITSSIEIEATDEEKAEDIVSNMLEKGDIYPNTEDENVSSIDMITWAINDIEEIFKNE